MAMKTEIGLPYKYSKSVKGYTQLEEVLKNWLKEHKVVHGSRKTWKDFHYRKFYYKKATKKIWNLNKMFLKPDGLLKYAKNKSEKHSFGKISINQSYSLEELLRGNFAA